MRDPGFAKAMQDAVRDPGRMIRAKQHKTNRTTHNSTTHQKHHLLGQIEIDHAVIAAAQGTGSIDNLS